MNNHEAVTCLDKAIIELNQLFESCDKKFENQVWEILQTVCNAKKSLDSLTPQTENDIEISDAVSAARCDRDGGYVLINGIAMFVVKPSGLRHSIVTTLTMNTEKRHE